VTYTKLCSQNPRTTGLQWPVSWTTMERVGTAKHRERKQRKLKPCSSKPIPLCRGNV